MRRSHWYTILLLSTVLTIVGCTSEPVENETAGTGATVSLSPLQRMTAREDVTISMVARADDDDLTDVTVVSNATGAETKFPGLVDVFTNHYKAAQYAAGSLFVIHRTGGSDGYASNPEWTDSLWRYETTGSGRILFQGRGLDARVSYDGRFIAAVTDKELIVIRDGGVAVTKIVDTLIPKDRPLMISPASVSNNAAWFELTQAASFKELLRIDARTGAIEKTDVTAQRIGSVRTVDPVTGRIVYWDMPVAFDIDEEENAATKLSNIRIFDPKTKKDSVLVELPAGKRLEEMYWQDNALVVYREMGSSTFVSLPIN